MRIYIPARAMRIMTTIGVRVQLGEDILDSGGGGRKSEGLIPVITGIKIAGFEEFGHRHLGHLFPIPEYAELSFPRQYFLPPQQAGLTAFAGTPVILQYLFPESIKG